MSLSLIHTTRDIMDITTLSARDTATITLKHPGTGEPMEGVTVTVHGPGSRQHQAATSARNQRIFDRMSGPKKAKLSADDQAREQATFLAACTAGISGWDYKGGTGPADIEAAYRDASVGWIADQVSTALGDWSTFLPEPAKS